MGHSVNPLERSVRKKNTEFYFIIGSITNCSLDCPLPCVSIVRMYSLQPFFPLRHPLFRIKSVYAIPLIRQVECVSSCHLPNPTTRVRYPLRLREVRFAGSEFLSQQFVVSYVNGCANDSLQRAIFNHGGTNTPNVAKFTIWSQDALGDITS